MIYRKTITSFESEETIIEHLISILELVLENIVHITMLLFEFIGVAVIIWSCLMALVKCISRSEDTAVYLGKGLALGLEFLMGGEILRTVFANDWHEIGIIAGIIGLRTALSLVLHWEIHQEEKAMHEHH